MLAAKFSRGSVRFWIRVLWLGGTLGVSSATSALPQPDGLPTDTTFTNDPRALALYERMIDSMRQARSLYYESDYRVFMDDQMIGACSYKLWMKKPGYARLESFHQGKAAGVLIGDGKCFWMYWPNGRPGAPPADSTRPDGPVQKEYLQDQIPANAYSIAHRVMDLGSCMIMTAYEPSVFHGKTEPLLRDGTDGARVLRSETVSGEPCDLIQLSMMDHQRNRFVWLSQRDHLPRKIREVVTMRTRNSILETWSSVRINGRMSDRLFAWEPPADWVQWYPSESEAQQLSPGASAPDFDLPIDGGGRLRLSDQRGKVVLLSFWRVGCPPCRDEVPILQQLEKDFGPRGLVVLGINTMDDPAIARRFLRKNGATYLNVIDSTRAAVEVWKDAYHVGGVPQTYLLDAEGKVVDRWLGFDRTQGVNRFKEALSRAGMR